MLDKTDESQNEKNIGESLVSGEFLESWPDKSDKKKPKASKTAKKAEKEFEIKPREEEPEPVKDKLEENMLEESIGVEELKAGPADKKAEENIEKKKIKKETKKEVPRRDKELTEKEVPRRDKELNKDLTEPITIDEMPKEDLKKDLKEAKKDEQRAKYKEKSYKEESNAWQYFWYAIILLVIAAVLLTQFKTAGKEKEPSTNVLFVVNGQELTQNDLDKELKKIPDQLQNLVPREEVEKSLIRRTLLLQEAKKRGINIDNEDLAIQELLENFTSNITVYDDEAEVYYLNNIDQFNVSESVRVRHILLCYEGTTGCNVNSTEEEAKVNVARILQLLDKGADFEELAMNYSSDPSVALNKGDLGFITKGQTAPEFEKLSFSLDIGEVSFTKTEFGFHIIQKIDKREAGVLTFESVKEKLKEFLLAQKQREAVQKYIEELEANADIERKNSGRE